MPLLCRLDGSHPLYRSSIIPEALTERKVNDQVESKSAHSVYLHESGKIPYLIFSCVEALRVNFPPPLREKFKTDNFGMFSAGRPALKTMPIVLTRDKCYIPSIKVSLMNESLV